MEAVELHAADDMNVSLVWADFNRLFMNDRNSLVNMLLEIKQQMAYGSGSSIPGSLPSTVVTPSPRKSRTGWVRRVLNKFKG